MRTVDIPFVVSSADGAIHLECGGARVSFDPIVAARAGGHLIARATAARQEFGPEADQCDAHVGELLIERAAEVARRERAETPHPAGTSAPAA